MATLASPSSFQAGTISIRPPAMRYSVPLQALATNAIYRRACLPAGERRATKQFGNDTRRATTQKHARRQV